VGRASQLGKTREWRPNRRPVRKECWNANSAAAIQAQKYVRKEPAVQPMGAYAEYNSDSKPKSWERNTLP